MSWKKNPTILLKTPPLFTKIISGYKSALQITFWDAYDCQAIRLIDGSLSSEMNCLDITPDGEGFVSGGVDREVKLWNYDEGHCYFVGLGHSGPITKVIDPPFLHPLSPQFVCPKFPQILKGTFLWISLPTTNSILNLHLLLKLLFYVYTSPEHNCLEEHKRWDFYEVEWLSVEWSAGQDQPQPAEDCISWRGRSNPDLGLPQTHLQFSSWCHQRC